jgi:hypothetical protein
MFVAGVRAHFVASRLAVPLMLLYRQGRRPAALTGSARALATLSSLAPGTGDGGGVQAPVDLEEKMCFICPTCAKSRGEC